MRTFFGYLLILLLVPLFALLTILTYNELNSFQPLQQYLDKHIPIKDASLSVNSVMTASDGSTISEIYNEQNRVYLQLDEIPTFMKDLFITTEDQHFFEHKGVDALAITRAILVNSQNQALEQGGSTITQQLARNLFLNHEKTYNRKLSELLYSYQLEWNLSKEEILELYLNAIYFQNGAYGIEAASQKYFNKSVSKLSKAEMAFIAAIPNNPNLYNPIKHFEATKERQERLLEQMLTAGKLKHSQYSELIQEKVSLRIDKRVNLYPDYVTYVEKELHELVAQQEGLSLLESDFVLRTKNKELVAHKVKELLESGIIINTALDKDLQLQAKRAIDNELSTTGIQGVAVVIQHHTHELVSLTGGKYYKKYSFHRGFQSFRQPGSAIKPLLVYAPYIDQTNASLDETIDSRNFCEKGYCPDNYDGATYDSVTLEKAFAKSINTPAVRLLDKIGIRKGFSYLEPFHFTKVSDQDQGLAAAVGGFTYGMSPLQLTSAYTSFVDGNYTPSRAIRSVTDRQGKVLYQWQDKPIRVWKDSTVEKMRQLLQSVVKEGTARKAYYPSSYIGGKTGTTNDVKDLWFVGMDDTYTTGVWMGKDRPASIESFSKSSPHLRAWKKIMQTTQ
ncbi:transglycosylase domain-containing protein [Peribacillus alkalitolerans]|uniref:transglycosylase domain-containing protein n=1 Tax=Peribacillus alkalitolerans TaxID=1550385 RepID=UPI0013D12949|nr:transglycosylase domain-containing protein [Peribacillus alkalitolerans]